MLTRGATFPRFDLGVIYFATSLPFLGSGIVVSLVISETIERVDRIYFFDLLGAAGGCLALVLLLNRRLADRIPFSPSPYCSLPRRHLVQPGWREAGPYRKRFRSASLLTMLIIANTKYHFVEVRYAKGQKLHDEQFTKWNSISRIGMARDKESGGEMIYHRCRRLHRHCEFRLQPSLATDLRLPPASGAEHPVQPPARREDAGDRPRGRLGCRARDRIRQP